MIRANFETSDQIEIAEFAGNVTRLVGGLAAVGGIAAMAVNGGTYETNPESAESMFVGTSLLAAGTFVTTTGARWVERAMGNNTSARFDMLDDSVDSANMMYMAGRILGTVGLSGVGVHSLVTYMQSSYEQTFAPAGIDNMVMYGVSAAVGCVMMDAAHRLRLRKQARQDDESR